MKELSETLRACRELADISEEVRLLVAGHLEQRRYPKGALLMREGGPGDCLMVLAEGDAMVAKRRDDGSERVLGFFRRGEIFGEMALLTKEPRSATVYADTDVRVLVLGAQAFDELATRHPQVAVVLTNLLADRLGHKSEDALGGKVLDRYRIVRCVGRGAMAVVYEATDVEARQTVALKMMSHRLVYQEGALPRFEREARILLHLDHPNIARVHGTFPAFRTSFIAMEFCDGPALAALIPAARPLPEPAVRGIVGQLAGALAHLHGKGVVHRDLKPGNVMFTRTGTLKLMDFGLAVPGPDLGGPTESQTRRVMGTPLFMAPEQFAGGAPTDRADLYALGCLIYEMLDGRSPFRTTDLYELIEMKRSFEMPDRRIIGRGVSREVADLIATLLRVDPERRQVDLARLAQWARPVDAVLLAAVAPPLHQDRIVRH